MAVCVEGPGTLPKSHSQMSCSSGGKRSAEPGGRGAEAVQVSEHCSCGSRAPFPGTARHTTAVPSSPGVLSPAAALGTRSWLELWSVGTVPEACRCSGPVSTVCRSGGCG